MNPQQMFETSPAEMAFKYLKDELIYLAKVTGKSYGLRGKSAEKMYHKVRIYTDLLASHIRR